MSDLQTVNKLRGYTDKVNTLIDHLISNLPERILHTDVLPCSLVSNHDAVYAAINIKVTRSKPKEQIHQEFEEL